MTIHVHVELDPDLQSSLAGILRRLTEMESRMSAQLDRLTAEVAEIPPTEPTT